MGLLQETCCASIASQYLTMNALIDMSKDMCIYIYTWEINATSCDIWRTDDECNRPHAPTHTWFSFKPRWLYCLK